MLSILNLILPALMPLLNKLIPDPQQQAQAQAEIAKAIMSQQAEIMAAMKDVMVADSQSESWLVKNARPMTVFWCLAVMTWIVGQTFVAAWGASNLWARVDELERQARSAAPQAERIIRLEEKIGVVQEGIAEIKTLIRRTLADRRPP